MLRTDALHGHLPSESWRTHGRDVMWTRTCGRYARKSGRDLHEGRAPDAVRPRTDEHDSQARVPEVPRAIRSWRMRVTTLRWPARVRVGSERHMIQLTTRGTDADPDIVVDLELESAATSSSSAQTQTPRVPMRSSTVYGGFFLEDR